MDARIPGMIYGAGLQCPWHGGKPDKIDDRRARMMPGVIDIVPLPNCVGVLAGTPEQAFAAKNALVVTWTEGPAAHYDSEKVLEQYRAIAKDKSARGVDFAVQGDVDAASRSAKRVLTSDFQTRHVYHAQMEPLNARPQCQPMANRPKFGVACNALRR